MVKHATNKLKQELKSKYSLCDGRIVDVEDEESDGHYIYRPLQTAQDFATFVMIFSKTSSIDIKPRYHIKIKENLIVINGHF